MFKKVICVVCLLAFGVLFSGCSFNSPESERRFVGEPGRDYTWSRVGFVVRQNWVYAVKDLTRILLWDRPSNVHENFVDY